MKSIFLLCGVLGAVSDASECQAEEHSLLQAKRVVRKHVQQDSKAVLKNMRDVANSLLEGSDTTMTSDEVNDALDAASNALAELSPAIRQQIENAQQQINDAASAVLTCHSHHQAQLRSSLREAAEERAAAVESCHSTLDQLRADETQQCNTAEDCLCDEARVRTTDQEALCTSMTETYEVAFCEHHHMCNVFHQCHSSEADVFTRLRADVEAEMALAVVEYTAVEQSRCLTGLIMEAMTPPLTPISHAALIACDDVDVSALQIDYPSLPAEPDACPAHAHGEPECVPPSSGWTMDGCLTSNAVEGEHPLTQSSNPADTADVQCCSMDGETCVRQDLPGGEDWSSYRSCIFGATYAEAQAVCDGLGKRLCHAHEVETGLCCNTGCYHNHHNMWVLNQAPAHPAECSPEVLEKCQGNVPCIDLREGEPHHHLMWLNQDGTAHVDGEAGGIGAGDARTWTCTRAGDGEGLVGTWTCPGFYGTAIIITPDYADDFTTARNNDHISVCALA